MSARWQRDKSLRECWFYPGRCPPAKGETPGQNRHPSAHSCGSRGASDAPGAHAFTCHNCRGNTAKEIEEGRLLSFFALISCVLLCGLCVRWQRHGGKGMNYTFSLCAFVSLRSIISGHKPSRPRGRFGFRISAFFRIPDFGISDCEPREALPTRSHLISFCVSLRPRIRRAFEPCAADHDGSHFALSRNDLYRVSSRLQPINRVG